jgi:DNA-binding LytR/AlgR family response regulator
MKTRCLLVDDEPIALDILETYLSRLPEVELVARCTNAIQAMEVVRSNHIDLMFLDIKMPQFDGISFLKSLQKPPGVILTTAYREYALDGYDLNIIDYLLKPISFERFMKAVAKYYEQRKDSTTGVFSKAPSPALVEPFVYIKSEKKTIKVYLKDIFFIESLKDYVIIHKRDSKIISRDKISRLEEILPHDMFLRIHRSYIVSIPKIEAITPDSIEIAKKELPIARNYKQTVAKMLNVPERAKRSAPLKESASSI